MRALNPERRRFFANDNPVVVYNPHFDERTGSWARLGTAVLDFFLAHPAYNLIFAPHVVLFARAWRHRGFLPERFRRGASLNDWDEATFYGGGEAGYTDYPALAEGGS